MIGSISEKDLRSHKILLRMGTVKGPGGSWWVLELFLATIRRLSRTEMQREMRMRNQASMFLVLSLMSYDEKGDQKSVISMIGL